MPNPETVNTVAASGSAVTIPAAATATVHDITLTATCTLTFPTAVNGASFTLLLRQGGSGSYTVTWPSPATKWPNGAVPVLSTAVDSVDIISFLSDGTVWRGMVAGVGWA